jgi:hypothetical protein
MNIISFIATEFVVPVFMVAVFVGLLVFVRNSIIKYATRWALRRADFYSSMGVQVRLNPQAIFTFAGTIAMCLYGLVLVIGGFILLFLGYEIKKDGLNPDMSILWMISSFVSGAGLSWMVLMGKSAYELWSKSIQPLHAEYLELSKK